MLDSVTTIPSLVLGCAGGCIGLLTDIVLNRAIVVERCYSLPPRCVVNVVM